MRIAKNSSFSKERGFPHWELRARGAWGRGVAGSSLHRKRDSLPRQRSIMLRAVLCHRVMMSVTSVMCCVVCVAGIVETGAMSIIDAVSLSEVINLKKDQCIMQPTCVYLCARMPAIAFLLDERDSAIARFWGQSQFRRSCEISISS